jgi:hypothetical protein
MTGHDTNHTAITDEIRLVEMALEETESRQMTCKDLQEKERLEIRILDYEQHLKVLSNKLELYENEVG